MGFISFCTLPLSANMFVKSVHANEHRSIMAETTFPLYKSSVPCSVHSSRDGHLGCFLF